MPDIAQASTAAHTHFEVPVSVDGEDSTAVLHLDVEVWGNDGVTITRADMISFRADAEALPARGSEIACSDLSAVDRARNWVVTDRADVGGDGHVLTWHMRKDDG